MKNIKNNLKNIRKNNAFVDLLLAKIDRLFTIELSDKERKAISELREKVENMQPVDLNKFDELSKAVDSNINDMILDLTAKESNGMYFDNYIEAITDCIEKRQIVTFNAVAMPKSYEEKEILEMLDSVKTGKGANIVLKNSAKIIEGLKEVAFVARQAYKFGKVKSLYVSGELAKIENALCDFSEIEVLEKIENLKKAIAEKRKSQPKGVKVVSNNAKLNKNLEHLEELYATEQKYILENEETKAKLIVKNTELKTSALKNREDPLLIKSLRVSSNEISERIIATNENIINSKKFQIGLDRCRDLISRIIFIDKSKDTAEKIAEFVNPKSIENAGQLSKVIGELNRYYYELKDKRNIELPKEKATIMREDITINEVEAVALSEEDKKWLEEIETESLQSVAKQTDIDVLDINKNKLL